MWLISVTPISRGINKERLYYFSANKFSEGDLIEVPIRSRLIAAKVEEVKSVMDAKQELKSIPFPIRKAATLKAAKFFSDEYMAAAEKTAKYYCSTLGAVLHSLLPPKRILSSLETPFVSGMNLHGSGKILTEVLQCPDEERMSAFRRMIREEFAKKRSVIIVAPTINETISIFNETQKGVEQYAYLFHQRIAKSTLSSAWRNAVKSAHPILAVLTPQFMGLPRKDIGTIALDRESSRNYKKDSRPFIDYRVFASYLSQELRTTMIFADAMIRTETYQKLEQGEAYEYGKALFRPLFPIKTEIFIVDKKAGKKTGALDENTQKFIKEIREEGHRLFVLSPRRGLAPRTICRTCGKGLLCERCFGSLVLHGANRKSAEDITLFVCHRCGLEVDPRIRCSHCGSWDLMPFRVGSEQIERDIKELMPDSRVMRIDSDSVTSEPASAQTVKKFLSFPGSVLIATEMAFNYISDRVEGVLVLFPELLTSVPEYNGDENALRFILRAKSMASRRFAVETAEPDLPVMRLSDNSNLADFYRTEIELRKTLGYPPFSCLILITYKSNAEITTQIEKNFSSYEPVFFEGMGKDKEERVFFRIPIGKWPDPKFRELCLALPQNCSIEVMPDKLFS